jgi:hypothetical protein
MRYYLAAEPVTANARPLLGRRAIAGLAPGAASTGTAIVWIPLGTSPGSYYVLACADGLGAVAESDEADNCRASRGRVEVSWRP